MSKQTEDSIRAAWSDLLYLADTWDWTAPRMLRTAEKAEAKNARSAGIHYPKVEQLAGLCETALKRFPTVKGLYGLRDGHRDVTIVAAAMTDRFPEEMQAWRADHGAAIRAFRAAALVAK